MKTTFLITSILVLVVAGFAYANEPKKTESTGVGASIKNSAKKVGQGVAEGAKRSGKEIAKAAKQVVKATADTAKSAGKKIKDDVKNKNFKPKPNAAVPKEARDRGGDAQPVTPSTPRVDQTKSEKDPQYGRE